jgi:hypothetical protein
MASDTPANGSAVVRALSTCPMPAPCCQHAHERGYRRGYRHGYTYAVWDIGKVARFSDGMWRHIQDFLWAVLLPWSTACREDEVVVRRENGPRLSLRKRE